MCITDKQNNYINDLCRNLKLEQVKFELSKLDASKFIDSLCKVQKEQNTKKKKKIRAFLSNEIIKKNRACRLKEKQLKGNIRRANKAKKVLAEVVDGSFLIPNKNKRKAHIIIDGDTGCRMALNGGLNVNGYSLAEEPLLNSDICMICKSEAPSFFSE